MSLELTFNCICCNFSVFIACLFCFHFRLFVSFECFSKQLRVFISISLFDCLSYSIQNKLNKLEKSNRLLSYKFQCTTRSHVPFGNGMCILWFTSFGRDSKTIAFYVIKVKAKQRTPTAGKKSTQDIFGLIFNIQFYSCVSSEHRNFVKRK